MTEHSRFEGSVYLIGLIASTVYVAVLGYLSTREYVCNSVAGLACPQSPFNAFHLLMHTALLGYLFLLVKRIPKELRWKWLLLCAIVIVFLLLVLLQKYYQANSALIYTAVVASLVCFGIFFSEKRIEGATQQIKNIKLIKILLAALVLCVVFIFLRISGIA